MENAERETFRIAIVEDSQTEAETISTYLNRFSEEKGCSFSIVHFTEAKNFLANVQKSFEIILMDIDLPDMNGLEAIKLLRNQGCDATVIFVTNMAQFAIRGYEVHAFDFIVKPVSYYNFSLKLESALLSLKQKQTKEIWISNKEGKTRLKLSRVTYIEVLQHMLVYHTLDGEFRATGSLEKIAAELQGYSFSLCNRCFLVNLRYVTAIKTSTVVVDGKELVMSRLKRSSFVRDVNNFLAFNQ